MGATDSPEISSNGIPAPLELLGPESPCFISIIDSLALEALQAYIATEIQ